MLNSIIHQPCEVSLHLYSSDVFVHPPRPNADLPGDDKTLQGLVEIRVPSERTIQSVKVTLHGQQTLAIPERVAEGMPGAGVVHTRYEDKTLLDKTVEISSEALAAGGTGSGGGKGKGKEKQQPVDGAVTTTNGIHLEKGIHGFEFAFIIPASSAPFERGRYGRVRYTLTATAIGAGRGRANVSASREIFIILHVNADGGPVPLDIQYHDAHEALGALSVSLTSASLSVGGAATLSIYHPSPPPGLSVHVVRVFLEQTIELYSNVRGGWMKLPTEKLRLWERGYMPYKEQSKQIDPTATAEDALWIRADDGQSHGRPGRATIAGGFGVPTLAPYGTTMHPGTGGGGVGGATSGSFQTSPAHSLPPTPSGGIPSAHVMRQQDGYKLKAVLRLPDDNVIRPSTVRGSRAEIRVSHELGVEMFFSRASVLDERSPHGESYGKPKVQVFSMRRATIIPSCCATFDAIHLPPYSLESPMASRPPSPGPHSAGRGRAAAPAAVPIAMPSPNDLDHWKLTQTLRAALGSHANAGNGATGVHSAEQSMPGSAAASRSSSPTRQPPVAHSSSTGALGYFHAHAHGRRSRPSSPTLGAASSTEQPPPTGATTAGSSSRRSAAGAAHLHALTPSHTPSHTPSQHRSAAVAAAMQHNNTFPTVITAPASGSTTPKSLPPNSPWALGNFPVRSSTSHEQCQCGRSTEELMDAEQRLLDGAPTAPGVWIDAHDEGQLPPPWTPSRPSSPVLDAQIDDAREGVRARGKIGEMLSANGSPNTTSPFPPHAAEDHDSDDDGGHM